MPVSSRAFGLTQGSFERRYNHRLHQTAPREHRSHAGHGQPLVSPARIRRSGLVNVGYTAGTSVPRTVPVGGAVDRGLSGRAAPLVNRSR